MRILALALVPLICVAALACGRSEKRDDGPGAASVQTNAAILEADAEFVSAASELGVENDDAGAARALASSSTAGEKLPITAGSFPSGSMPGDEGRVPSIEPALASVSLGAFAIDALPYPNDPTAPPELVESPEEAARLCAERGARLCTELEWERACKGPDDDRYATGPAWNPACNQTPSRCASGFGVRAMGFMQEWTDSRFDEGNGEPGSAVVRGGPAPVGIGLVAPATGRRCAARSRATAKGMPARTAFRCCHGERNAAAIAPIESRPAFRKTTLEAADLAKIFAEVPELTRISEGVRLFSSDEAKSILARSSSSGYGITFATSPILWSPETGVELLVATGRAKRTAFVVALWPLPEGKYRFASSFLLLGDSMPVALAYESSRRNELRWAACWHCAGEHGAVSLRDDGRVVIVQY